MNAVAIVSILLGLTIILLRGPLIFAPEETKNLYLKVLSSAMRIRMMGLILAVLGVAMVSALTGAPGLLAEILVFVGMLFVAVSIAFIAPFPAAVKTLMETVFDVINNTVARVLGVIAVAIGVLLIYAGAAA